ncbi:MAG: hypothetical protein EOO71_00190 [Myxococcaceae bacterium]|nr:MAG: hypothetical protein EOO71_00190 [Myxococcaceae bacterium]
MFTESTQRLGMALIATLGVGALMGCGGAPEASMPSEQTPLEAPRSSEADLYVASSTLWRPVSIPVCWENPAAGNATQRQWVRDAVTRTWEANSSVRFYGWGTCPFWSSGVRINISDVGPHVKALGNGLNGMAQGMVLNFTFANWSPSCASSLKYCIDAIAVHEFGHALGYAHEQNRPDRPSTCTEPAQGSSGDWLIGPWDLGSVMNYCNPAWNGNGNLSATDVQGAKFTYGIPWESLGGGLNSGPAAASWGANRLDVFVRGLDSQMHHQYWAGAGWSGWGLHTGVITSDPAAASWGNNRIDVFARGADNSMLHKAWDGVGWSPWYSQGGTFNSGPAVASWGANRLDVFGQGADNQLYHQAWTGSGWTSWNLIPGVVTSDPAAVSWGPNRIDLFARGTDNTMLHKAWDGAGWSPWYSLGGTFTSAPAAVSRGVNRLEVFGRGADNSLWVNAWTGSSWSGWNWLGGEMTSAPDVASWGPGRMDVFYRGTDNTLRHSWYVNGW